MQYSSYSYNQQQRGSPAHSEVTRRLSHSFKESSPGAYSVNGGHDRWHFQSPASGAHRVTWRDQQQPRIHYHDSRRAWGTSQNGAATPLSSGNMFYSSAHQHQQPQYQYTPGSSTAGEGQKVPGRALNNDDVSILRSIISDTCRRLRTESGNIGLLDILRSYDAVLRRYGISPADDVFYHKCIMKLSSMPQVAWWHKLAALEQVSFFFVLISKLLL